MTLGGGVSRRAPPRRASAMVAFGERRQGHLEGGGSQQFKVKIDTLSVSPIYSSVN
jgi:hypothetical protein